MQTTKGDSQVPLLPDQSRTRSASEQVISVATCVIGPLPRTSGRAQTTSSDRLSPDDQTTSR